jgi:hypothetical protein
VIPVIVVAVVLVDLVVDMVLVRWWIRKLRNEAVNALREAVGGEKVFHVEDCNFFGRQSRGYAQVRGNGLLALTDRGIHFRMFLPRRYLFIPLEDVGSVSVAGSFLGKSRGRKILRVDFRTSGGGDDACGWLVPSPGWWVEALRSLSAGKEPPPTPWKEKMGDVTTNNPASHGSLWLLESRASCKVKIF